MAQLTAKLLIIPIEKLTAKYNTHSPKKENSSSMVHNFYEFCLSNQITMSII